MIQWNAATAIEDLGQKRPTVMKLQIGSQLPVFEQEEEINVFIV
jgi:hypothetical protein